MSEEIIEDMPEFTKGFSDAPPKLLYDFSETTDPIEELTEEEYRTRNLRYDTEEFSEKISEWAEEIELGKIEYEDDDEETEETVANDAIESLLTVARGAARALEKATQLRPEFSKNLMQASDDWPIIVSNSQVGWEEDGVPDQVWSTLKKLSKNPGKAKSSRLFAWVKASLRAILELRKRPEYSYLHKSLDAEEMEVYFRMPNLIKPYSDINQWTEAVYLKIRKDAFWFADTKSDVDTHTSAGSQLMMEYSNPYFGESQSSATVPHLISETETNNLPDHPRALENEFAFALFRQEYDAAIATYRSTLMQKKYKSYNGVLNELKRGLKDPESILGDTRERAALEEDPIRDRQTIVKINQEIKDLEAIREKVIKQAKNAELPISLFDKAAKDAIRYRLKILFK